MVCFWFLYLDLYFEFVHFNILCTAFLFFFSDGGGGGGGGGCADC